MAMSKLKLGRLLSAAALLTGLAVGAPIVRERASQMQEGAC